MLLVLVGVLFLLFTGQLFWSLSNVVAQNTGALPRPTPRATSNRDVGPLLPPGQSEAPLLTLPTGKYVVYQQQKNISLVPLTGGLAATLTTPGYVYNLAVPPIVMAAGQLIYSGDGLWITDVFSGMPRQIAAIPKGQVVTSMLLSSDGTTIAWSTEPANGVGNNTLYVGPLEKSVPVYQNDAAECPCYRFFAFLQRQGLKANSTLLLTNDRGDHRAVHYGLWSLNVSETPLEDPQPLLPGDASQGPLALSPDGTTLLYSTKQDVVPTTDDLSVPIDIAALNYANSLSLAHIGVSASNNDSDLLLQSTRVLLPEQHDLSNNAAYHWITTPTFSPDGHTLLYIVFSSDAQTPFDRHSALYMVHTTNTGGKSSVGTPQLLANSTDLFVELGAWIDNTSLTFYSDGTLYALNTSNGSVATIVKTTTYARVLAVVQGGDA